MADRAKEAASSASHSVTEFDAKFKVSENAAQALKVLKSRGYEHELSCDCGSQQLLAMSTSTWQIAYLWQCIMCRRPRMVALWLQHAQRKPSQKWEAQLGQATPRHWRMSM